MAASAIAQGAGALFNAFAFAGASFAFSKVGQGDILTETKRHDEAMEKYTKDKNDWDEARLNEIDRVENLHHFQDVAERDRQDTLNDFERYARVQESKQKRYDLEAVKAIFKKTEPKLENYYKPSPEFQKYVNYIKYAMSFALTSVAVFVLL